MDPCGRVVDFLRNCYETEMWFSLTDRPRKVRWYWCQPGAELLGFPTPFASRNHFEQPWYGVGEARPRTNEDWNDGSFPIVVSGTAGPCGDPAVWEQGYDGDVPPIYHRNQWGLLFCCGGVTGGPSLSILAYVPKPPIIPARSSVAALLPLLIAGERAKIVMQPRPSAFGATVAPVAPIVGDLRRGVTPAMLLGRASDLIPMVRPDAVQPVTPPPRPSQVFARRLNELVIPGGQRMYVSPRVSALPVATTPSFGGLLFAGAYLSTGPITSPFSGASAAGSTLLVQICHGTGTTVSLASSYVLLGSATGGGLTLDSYAWISATAQTSITVTLSGFGDAAITVAQFGGVSSASGYNSASGLAGTMSVNSGLSPAMGSVLVACLAADQNPPLDTSASNSYVNYAANLADNAGYEQQVTFYLPWAGGATSCDVGGNLGAWLAAGAILA